jgi:hypothetical protein
MGGTDRSAASACEVCTATRARTCWRADASSRLAPMVYIYGRGRIPRRHAVSGCLASIKTAEVRKPRSPRSLSQNVKPARKARLPIGSAGRGGDAAVMRSDRIVREHRSDALRRTNGARASYRPLACTGEIPSTHGNVRPRRYSAAAASSPSSIATCTASSELARELYRPSSDPIAMVLNNSAPEIQKGDFSPM